MRALQLCPNDHPPFLDLCRNHAAALAEAGVETDTAFFAPPRSARWDAATYFGIERGTRRMTAALQEYCRGRDYGLVIAHRYRAHQVATRARIVPLRRIVTVAHEFGMFRRWRRRARQQWFAADVTFAGVSQAVVDEFRREHPALRHLQVLPNPVDVDRLDRSRLTRAAARSALGVPDRAWVAGVVGRLHPEKRPQLALEAFAATTCLPSDARLVFVGDGALRGALEASARERGIADRVCFTGRRPDAAIHLNAFDVLLVTSGPTEAFGMTLLEGMVSAVPIVCADQPGPRSVLGPDGIYFDGDSRSLTRSLERCVALSGHDRDALGRAQRERAERMFSTVAVGRIYRELLNTVAPHPAVAS